MLTRTKMSNILKRMMDAIDLVAVNQTRYLLGGENPFVGLDCSGFVQHVLMRAGAPLLARLDADQLMKEVYTSTVAPTSLLGEYARRFCAYGFYDDEELTHFGHITIPYTHGTWVEMNVRDHARVLPEAIWTSGDVDENYDKFVEEGYGLGDDERFWALAELVLTVKKNKEHWSLDALDFSGITMDYSLHIPRTAEAINEIRGWAITEDALSVVNSLILGRDRRILHSELEFMLAKDGEAPMRFDLMRDLPISMITTSYRLLALQARLAMTELGVSYYYFMDLWATWQSTMGPKDIAGPLASGINFYPVDLVPVSPAAGRRGYMSPAFLESFLESEGSAMADAPNGKLQSLPVRRIH